MVMSLSLVSHFDKVTEEKLSELVKLRNIITHEYLDIRWSSIKKFIEENESLYREFLVTVQKHLKTKI